MNAPLEPALTDRILSAIAKATSQRPASAADVLAMVGGSEKDFWAAYAQLTHSLAINTAHIHRPSIDAAPWLAIWPTGIKPDHSAAGWKGEGHGVLFAKSRQVPRFPAAPDPTRDPRPDLGHAPVSTRKPVTTKEEEPTMSITGRTNKLTDHRRGTIVRMAADLDSANGVPLKDVAAMLEVTVQAVEYLVKGLEPTGKVKKVRLPGEMFNRLYDPRTDTQDDGCPKGDPDCIADNGATHDACQADHLRDSTKMIEQPAYRHDDIEVRELVAGDAPAPAADAAAEVRFGLWDDGSLTIMDDDTVLQFGPDIVRRLALLLGVPAGEVRP